MREPHKNRDRFNLNYLGDRPMKIRGCDQPGCGNAGDYRAPKSRDLNQYYMFCLDHVRDYNKAWDYFAGLPPSAIEDHIRQSAVWDRPTWPLGEWQKREEQLRSKLDEDFFGGTGEFHQRPEPQGPAMAAGEREALMALALSPPVTFVEIKAQYRILVKKHHPDANGGAIEAEEKFKSINQAFAVLKAIYATEDVE